MGKLFLGILFTFCALCSRQANTWAQASYIARYNPVWTSLSANSLESMPCGGGDVGLNVWVENGELLVYMAKSGVFDEHNTMPKLGRLRVAMAPNLLKGQYFKQELVLANGSVEITCGDKRQHAKLKIWVDAYKPVAHIEVASSTEVSLTADYETWRFEDLALRKRESNANSYKWAAPDTLRTKADSVGFVANGVLFYHRNLPYTVFDATVAQQGLDSVKHQLFNPLQKLTFGGYVSGTNMVPKGLTNGVYARTPFKGYRLASAKSSKTHAVTVALHTERCDTIDIWAQKAIALTRAAHKNPKKDEAATRQWWQRFWEKSFVVTDPYRKQTDSTLWQIGRNYQLFRHMLGCNATGDYPTKFNGGLFTVDPVFTDSTLAFTPDFRNWGGGTFTAQNQRLVYWPLLKSGDAALMKPQFDFYLRLLHNAELRSLLYWGHRGACFTEQMENFGLPNPSEYGWKRPQWFDKGVEYNAWLEYEWDTVLEFCQMMLETRRYANADVSGYVPFVESCLTFFDQHYQYQASRRGRKPLDGNGHLVLYPGSACETYKMAYNANSTIAALKTVTETLLQLPPHLLSDEKRAHWQQFLQRIPPLSFREINGKTAIAPAQLWERVNNTESPQLYPVYPWGMFGVGKPGIDTAVHTYLHDPDVLKFRSHVGWKQDLIWAARLGLTQQARELLTQKMGDSQRRYPVFWGPGFDWVPDHNWGGSGMIGLQEMLVQDHGDEIILLPAWPHEWDVHFKLHLPKQTTVELLWKDGKIEKLEVWPQERMRDVRREGKAPPTSPSGRL